jgi:4-hydroxyproline epimerase
MSGKTFFCIDGHTCGNPVRLVAGGGPRLEGASMSARRQDFLARYDWIRTALMFEPRGHDIMSGAILYPPCRTDCDVGVLYIEVSGCHLRPRAGAREPAHRGRGAPRHAGRAGGRGL